MDQMISRRGLLGTAAVAGAGFLLLGSERPARADDVLPGFPSGIGIRRDRFRNWDGVIVTESLWTCEPRRQDDVVAVVNWAREHGFTVRARGYMHSWAPMTVTPGKAQPTNVILVDTTVNLTAMSSPAAGRVRVEAGARMDTLLAYLGKRGEGLASAPAPGDVTVGGVVAVSGHGTAVRAAGEKRQRGQSMGTVSNLITAFTAVVWDPASSTYVARTFTRDHPDAKAFLTSIGRVFLLDVTLQTMADYSIRARNTTSISVSELFAAPSAAGARSLTKLLDTHGRVGVIWYTFTDCPWVQTWSVTPQRPLLSRPTTGPYNFPFADNLPEPVTTLIGRVGSGQSWLAPQMGVAVLAATTAGLLATGARDMWGPSRNFIHFVKPTTLRVSAGSHAVITSRSNVQRVVHEFATWITAKLKEYAARDQYPLNSCVEIRVTGTDTPSEVDVAGAEAPALSAAAPVDGHPDWDTVVWLDALTLPGTPHEYAFYAEMEAFVRRTFSGWALARPEWAKRWATSADGSWTDEAVMQKDVPAVFPLWEWTRSTFDRYDPYRLFTNPLLDALMPPR